MIIYQITRVDISRNSGWGTPKEKSIIGWNIHSKGWK